MKREIVRIDREKCTGCGDCIPNCHEGALQIIDGKATLVSELMCDGLGACLGHCPEGAISIEEREAEAYNESKVMEEIINNGVNVVKAHLIHLRDHQQFAFLAEGIGWLNENRVNVKFNVSELIQEIHSAKPELKIEAEIKLKPLTGNHQHAGGGCPGSQARTLQRPLQPINEIANDDAKSELRQWPVQLHLVSPYADYFRNSDLLLAADCSAFSAGNFHQKFLKGKSLAIACPKLDLNKEVYLAKLKTMIEESQLNTITVLKMEVPCCGGLLQIAKLAVENSTRKIPVKSVTMSIEGEIIQEVWV